MPQKFFELDVEVRPAEPTKKFLALYELDSESGQDANTATNGQGFLEKNLSDFFDIQIFSTVYFGSQHEPH